jgi:D-psicose/D-tagatose/L-ribulose 3-epimerase
MKIGISAFAWSSRFGVSQLGFLDGLDRHGIEAIELPIFRPNEIAVPELRRGIKAHCLEVTTCGILPRGINPISPDLETRKLSYTHLQRCIQTTAELGSTMLCGPLYAPIGYLPGRRRNSEEYRWALDCFQSLAKLLDDTGVRIALEPVNRGESFFMTTALEAKSFCEAIGHPSIGVNVDTFHSNIEEKNLPFAVLELGSHLKHLHVSENDRGILGTGHIDLPAIISILKKMNYDGYLIIEGFGSSEGKVWQDTLWRDPNVTSEDLAIRSAAYLQRLILDDDFLLDRLYSQKHTRKSLDHASKISLEQSSRREEEAGAARD